MKRTISKERKKLIIILSLVFVVVLLCGIAAFYFVNNSAMLSKAVDASFNADKEYFSYKVKGYLNDSITPYFSVEESGYYAKKGETYDLVIGDVHVFDNVAYNDKLNKKSKITNEDSVSLYNEYFNNNEKDIVYDTLCLIRDMKPSFVTRINYSKSTSYYLYYDKDFYIESMGEFFDLFKENLDDLKVKPLEVKVKDGKVVGFFLKIEAVQGENKITSESKISVNYDRSLQPSVPQKKYEDGYYKNLNFKHELDNKLADPFSQNGSGNIYSFSYDKETLSRYFIVSNIKTGNVVESIPVPSNFGADNVFESENALYLSSHINKQILKYDFVTKTSTIYNFPKSANVCAIIGDKILVHYVDEGFYIGQDLSSLQPTEEYNAYGIRNIYYRNGTTYVAKGGGEDRELVILTPTGESNKKLSIGYKDWYFNSQGIVVRKDKNNDLGTRTFIQYDFDLNVKKEYVSRNEESFFYEETDEFLFFRDCVYDKKADTYYGLNIHFNSKDIMMYDGTLYVRVNGEKIYTSAEYTFTNNFLKDANIII